MQMMNPMMNPMGGYQSRLNYLEQMNNPMGQTGYTQAPTVLKGFPVADENAARSAQIDFDGSLSFFPCLSNGYIYTKRLNLNDCTPVFEVYKKVDMPASTSVSVSRAEFEEVRGQVNTLLQLLSGGTQNAGKSNDDGANVNKPQPTNASVMATGTTNDEWQNAGTATGNGTKSIL